MNFSNCCNQIKISNIFFDEFANLKLGDEYNIMQKNRNTFEIIDDLYLGNKEVLKINLNKFFKEYNSFNYQKVKSKFLKGKKSQLIVLDNNILTNFLEYNNQIFKSFKENEYINLDIIEQISISQIIQKKYNIFLNSKYYIQFSLVYIFSMTFHLLDFQTNLYFLSKILDGFQKIKYFHRYYLFILLKSINNKCIINSEDKIFPDLIQAYYNGIIINNY